MKKDKGEGVIPSPGEEEGGQEGVVGRALPIRTATRPLGLAQQEGLETPLGRHLASHAQAVLTLGLGKGGRNDERRWGKGPSR